MRHARPVPALAVGVLLGAVAMAGEHAGGANKLNIVSVADAPDPFSPPVAGEVEIGAAFDARPTDAGAGAARNEKAFSIRVSVEVEDEAGDVVRVLHAERPFEFPEMPASAYHPVGVTVLWDGKDKAGVPVPDGRYAYTVQGTLLRRDVLGNGKVQEHVCGVSGVLTGTVLLDSKAPEIVQLLPGDGEVGGTEEAIIEARIADATSGPDAEACIIRLDGQFVEATAEWDGGLVLTAVVTPGEGEHETELVALDRAGNSSVRTALWICDLAPPYVVRSSPADGEATNEPFAGLRIVYEDDASWVVEDLVTLAVDGRDVTALCETTPVEISYTPADPWPEGEVRWLVSLTDAAGHAAEAGGRFIADYTPPAASVEWARARTNDVRVGASGEFSDPVSGVESVEALRDGSPAALDVDFAAGVFDFVPAVDLLEGTHTVEVLVTDGAGNVRERSADVYVDLTRPLAPVVETVVRGPEQVNLIGPAPADVDRIDAEALGAEVESAVIESFSVVLRRTGPTGFLYRLRFGDTAGNDGAWSEWAEEHFEELVPPPELEGVLVLSDDYAFGEDGVYWTRLGSVRVGGTVTGGTPPYAVTVEVLGPAGETYSTSAPVNGAGMFTAKASVFPGANQVNVTVTDATGASAATGFSVSSDVAPPSIAITGPSTLKTEPYGVLCLRGDDLPSFGQPTTACWDRAPVWEGFSISGSASDDATGVTVTFCAKELPWSLHGRLRKVPPLLDYYAAPELDAGLLWENEDLKPLEERDIVSGGAALTFEVPAAALQVPELDAYSERYPVCALLVRAEDDVGNASHAVVFVVRDTTEPQETWGGPDELVSRNLTAYLQIKAKGEKEYTQLRESGERRYDALFKVWAVPEEMLDNTAGTHEYSYESCDWLGNPASGTKSYQVNAGRFLWDGSYRVETRISDRVDVLSWRCSRVGSAPVHRVIRDDKGEVIYEGYLYGERESVQYFQFGRSGWKGVPDGTTACYWEGIALDSIETPDGRPIVLSAPHPVVADPESDFYDEELVNRKVPFVLTGFFPTFSKAYDYLKAAGGEGWFLVTVCSHDGGVALAEQCATLSDGVWVDDFTSVTAEKIEGALKLNPSIVREKGGWHKVRMWWSASYYKQEPNGDWTSMSSGYSGDRNRQ